MRRAWWSLLAITVAVVAGAGGADAQDGGAVPEPVLREVTESVGLVTSAGFGSGWVVAPDTVLTNFHVARTTETYFTPAATGIRVRCYRAAASRDRDVALLKCPTGDLRPLPRRSQPARVGEAIAMVGYPGGQGPVATTGVVETVDQVVRDIPTVGVSAVGHPGSSGSPIVDASGRVVAIGTFGGVGPAINGVPVRAVARLIEDAGYLPATQAGAEWRLRAIRSLLLGPLAFAVGAYLQWRSGYPGVLSRGLRWATVAIVAALMATQFQLFMDGPVHFV